MVAAILQYIVCTYAINAMIFIINTINAMHVTWSDHILLCSILIVVVCFCHV